MTLAANKSGRFDCRRIRQRFLFETEVAAGSRFSSARLTFLIGVRRFNSLPFGQRAT